MDFNDIDKYHDILEEFVDKITERCYKVFKNKGEEMAKRILYLHENHYAEEDVELNNLVKEMLQFQKEASESNPYINLIDENS